MKGQDQLLRHLVRRSRRDSSISEFSYQDVLDLLERISWLESEVAQLTSHIETLEDCLGDYECPTESISTVPSSSPSFLPSVSPSAMPSTYPSATKSSFPSGLPSTSPITIPSYEPTTQPSGEGYAGPTRCGCSQCNQAALDLQAPEGAGPNFTCGSRIMYMEGQGLSELDACRFIAGVDGQFPDICQACDPDRCVEEVSPEPTLAPHTPPLSPEISLYCFPEYNQRVRWNDVWGEYTVEVKRDPNGGVCGPGNNKFTTSTVSLVDDELVLEFKKGANNLWEASEVRVILPEDKMPYSYGTFSFSVKAVSVVDTSNGQVISNHFSEDLVLGLFTWDTTERFDIHENWNHEVDIEISRWGNPLAKDGQFLVQPPEEATTFRFYTGDGGSFHPGGHSYQFTWNPTSVMWETTANGGQGFKYTTAEAIADDRKDHVQCLPADVEVRMNLWNIHGTDAPAGMSDNHVARVVIDNFSFTPSNVEGDDDGSVCTKHCQCLPDSRCINGTCTPV